MSLSRFLVTFRELPPPIRLTSILYIVGSVGYNMSQTYVDSKIYLKKYRNRTGHKYYINQYSITDDWEAVKFGASMNSLGRLWDTIFWPISTITNIVPVIVLTFNPPISKDPSN